MGKKIRIRIRDEQPGSYFRELTKKFVGVKILGFFYADPGTGVEKIRIRDGKIRIRNTEGQVPSQESQDTVRFEERKNREMDNVSKKDWLRIRSGFGIRYRPAKTDLRKEMKLMFSRGLEAPLGTWNVFFKDSLIQQFFRLRMFHLLCFIYR